MICFRCHKWPCQCPDGCTIIHGDCREVLGALTNDLWPENRPHTCVTSPPYFHQRDYGTATFEGGSQDCDHKPKNVDPNSIKHKTKYHAESLVGPVCKKCGATRIDQQIGLEESARDFISEMVCVFDGVRRVLQPDSTAWINLGDKWNNFNGNSGPGWMRERVNAHQNASRPKLPSGYGLECKELKRKDLLGIPWRTALALQQDGWWLRSDIIWSKPAAMPESVRDRPTSSHEHLFMMATSADYYFDFNAWKEPAKYRGTRGGSKNRYNNQSGLNDPKIYNDRNRRDVWTIQSATHSTHKATFPPKLIEPCILAGCPEGGIVIDPFLGSGTTAEVCRKLGRRCIGIELSEEYCSIACDRLRQKTLF